MRLVSGKRGGIFGPDFVTGGERRPKEGRRCPPYKDAIGCASHNRFGIGRHDPGRFNAVLATSEKGNERGELDGVREAVLLFGLTNTGNRQGVEQLGRHARAAAAGGHCHRRKQTRSSHVTAHPLSICLPMNKCLQALRCLRWRQASP